MYVYIDTCIAMLTKQQVYQYQYVHIFIRNYYSILHITYSL